jgi:hypothetical protein
MAFAWNPRSWTGLQSVFRVGGRALITGRTTSIPPQEHSPIPGTAGSLQDPNFWQKWIDRYQTLRPTELSTNALFAIIDSLTNQLAVAQTREMARWADSLPRSGTVIPPGTGRIARYSHSFPGTYAGEIAFLKRWIGDRLNFIDTNFSPGPTLNLTSGPVSIGQTVTITPAAKPTRACSTR